METRTDSTFKENCFLSFNTNISSSSRNSNSNSNSNSNNNNNTGKKIIINC